MLEKDLLTEVWRNIKEPNNIIFRSGFEDLDSLMGINRKNALITVGARPAMGKTTFIYTIIENLVKNNVKTLLFSFDVNKERVVNKLLFQHAEVNKIKGNTGNINNAEWDKLADGIEKLADWNLSVEDEALSINQIEEVIQKEMPEVVFIDYFQLIPKGENEDIALELKKLAKENDVTIIVTSQVSNRIEKRHNKRPLLVDLKNAESLANLSDVVIFIYRDEYYNFDVNQEIKNGNAEIIVAKNKFGACCSVKLTFKPEIPKFYDLLEDLVF